MPYLDQISSQTHIPLEILQTLKENARFLLRLRAAEAANNLDTQRVLHIATLVHTLERAADHPLFAILGDRSPLSHVPFFLEQLMALFPGWTENHDKETEVCEFCAILADIDDDQSDLNALVEKYNHKGAVQ